MATKKATRKKVGKVGRRSSSFLSPGFYSAYILLVDGMWECLTFYSGKYRSSPVLEQAIESYLSQSRSVEKVLGIAPDTDCDLTSAMHLDSYTLVLQDTDGDEVVSFPIGHHQKFDVAIAENRDELMQAVLEEMKKR